MRERNKRLQGREAKKVWKPVMLGNAASIHPSIWFPCVFVLFSTYQSLIKYMSPLKRVLNTVFSPILCCDKIHIHNSVTKQQQQGISQSTHDFSKHCRLALHYSRRKVRENGGRTWGKGRTIMGLVWLNASFLSVQCLTIAPQIIHSQL